MSKAAIQINDAGVLCAVDGVVSAPSPGYALLDREPVVFGEPAERAGRLDPLIVNNRYWDDLDDRPMLGRAAAGRSHADLAFLHLKQIWQEIRERATQVRCVVPASIKGHQLALLLGMARECDLPLEGFIDAGVAAATTWPGSARFLHVDLHLHKALITAVGVGERVRRERWELAAAAGWSGFVDCWMRMIAREFVAQTRFDPLHQAVSEQHLYDHLPALLEALLEAEQVEVQVPFGAEVHRVTLSREQFAHEAEALYADLLLRVHRLRTAGSDTTIAISERLASLPGLLARFAEFNDCTIVRGPAHAAVAAASVLDDLWQPSQDTVQLLCAAPRLATGTVPDVEWQELQQAQHAEAGGAPTHVLYRGQAIALRAEPLVIGLGPIPSRHRLQIVGAAAGVSRLHCSVIRTSSGAFAIDHSRYGTWLNDEPVVGRTALRAGDRLRLGRPGITLELITSE
jgi:hypothetical protein